MTPAPMTAIVSCSAIRLPYTIYAAREIGLAMKQIRVIDSHTAGEPTRLVLEGGPDLGQGPLDERVAAFSRTSSTPTDRPIVNEPRGSDPVVGALLCAPHRADCSVGVIFFNNVGFLGMCGHGTIGLVASLAHAGRLAPGAGAHRHAGGSRWPPSCTHDGTVDVGNVPSYRKARGVAIDVPGSGVVRGDVAWGGNWFFLVDAHDRRLSLRERRVADRLRVARAPGRERAGLSRSGSRGVVRASPDAGADSRNFVLCPGKAYDRSPCGTGTSAKLACLAADGTLAEGEDWRQESIIGSTFTAQLSLAGSRRRNDRADDQRPRARHRGGDAAARFRRSILLGYPMNEPLMTHDERSDHHAHSRQDPGRGLRARRRAAAGFHRRRIRGQQDPGARSARAAACGRVDRHRGASRLSRAAAARSRSGRSLPVASQARARRGG